MTKWCSGCKSNKPRTEFYARRDYPNGLMSRCKVCTKAAVVQWNEKNPDGLRARQKRFSAKHAAKKAAATAAWYRKNKNRNHANAAAWYKRNPHLGAKKTAAYRASQKRATPGWANQFFIEEAYHLASLRTKMLGYKWHVDHIVPLRSKIVCGLHVHNNLQVIPATENIKKNNRHWPDMPI